MSRPASKPVVRVSPTGEVTRYPSLYVAAQETGVDAAHLRQSIKRGHRVYGCVWHFDGGDG